MSAEACPDRRSALAAAAIGRLDEHEMLALQAHLDGCAACRRELAELQSVARLVEDVDVAHVRGAGDGAPPGLADEIVERVRDARREYDELAGRRARRRASAVVGAIAGVAASITLIVAFAVGSGSDHRAAAHRTVVLHGRDATARATITQASGGTDVAFHGRVDDTGHDRYWLWLTDASGHRLAAATFWDAPDGTFAIHGHGAIAYRDVKRVWVTDQHNRVVLDTGATRG